MKLFLKNDDDLLLISKTKKLKQLNTDNWSLNYTAAFDVEPLIPDQASGSGTRTYSLSRIVLPCCLSICFKQSNAAVGNPHDRDAAEFWRRDQARCTKSRCSRSPHTTITVFTSHVTCNAHGRKQRHPIPIFFYIYP